MTAQTRRQREVFDYITSFIERQGYKPSYEQIARHFRIRAKSAIAKHIAALEAQGLLTRRGEDGKFSLNLSPANAMSAAVCEIPLIEELTGDFLEELNAVSIFVPRLLLGELQPAQIFAFRVPSDAMIEAHICAGDIAIIERESDPRDGEIVVAMIENTQATLEQFFRHNAKIELRPANPTLEAAFLPAEAVTIRGVFRGLLRSVNGAENQLIDG